MPLKSNIKRVMVIGSGPIVIGQAAEFDYAGTQACRALKEEGLEVILVNSNPATIMTDGAMADQVYIEPLTLETVKRIIQKEQSRRPSFHTRRADGPDTFHAAGQRRDFLEIKRSAAPRRQSRLQSTRQRTGRCSRTPCKRSGSL